MELGRRKGPYGRERPVVWMVVMEQVVILVMVLMLAVMVLSLMVIT